MFWEWVSVRNRSILFDPTGGGFFSCVGDGSFESYLEKTLNLTQITCCTGFDKWNVSCHTHFIDVSTGIYGFNEWKTGEKREKDAPKLSKALRTMSSCLNQSTSYWDSLIFAWIGCILTLGLNGAAD